MRAGIDLRSKNKSGSSYRRIREMKAGTRKNPVYAGRTKQSGMIKYLLVVLLATVLVLCAGGGHY